MTAHGYLSALNHYQKYQHVTRSSVTLRWVIHNKIFVLKSLKRHSVGRY